MASSLVDMFVDAGGICGPKHLVNTRYFTLELISSRNEEKSVLLSFSSLALPLISALDCILDCLCV